ncbi:hypothetical protein Adt_17387 [Abeliophyllum distichum]|uniref:Uncharacterized protein n=1 Tax=Abeliophyllum distichum TaxID=126358 RepID=A0ABD1TGC7_9LAMI
MGRLEDGSRTDGEWVANGWRMGRERRMGRADGWASRWVANGEWVAQNGADGSGSRTEKEIARWVANGEEVDRRGRDGEEVVGVEREWSDLGFQIGAVEREWRETTNVLQNGEVWGDYSQPIFIQMAVHVGEWEK